MIPNPEPGTRNPELRPARPLRTWRPMAFWTAGLLLVLALAWYVAAVAVPAWQIDRLLRMPDPNYGNWIVQDEDRFVRQFGGRRGVISRMELYIGAPGWLAGHKSYAAGCLAYGGQEALPAIRKALASAVPEVRAGARHGLVHLICKSKDTSLVPEVIDGLLDADIRVRWEAAEALGRLAVVMPEADPEIAADIEKLLAHERFEIRSTAAAALWKATRDGQKPLAVLLAALEDKSPVVRLDAVRILSALGTDAEAALPALERTAKDADPKVRAAVECAQRECGDTFHWAMDNDEEFDKVLLSLTGDNWEVRARTALLLEGFHTCYRAGSVADAVAALQRALKDENPCVRDCAAYALRSFKPEQLAPPGPLTIEMDYDEGGRNIRYSLDKGPWVAGEEGLYELVSKKVMRRGELQVRLSLFIEYDFILRREMEAAASVCMSAGAMVCEMPKLDEFQQGLAAYARTGGRSATLLLRTVGVRNGLIQFRLNDRLAEGEDGLVQALREFSERTEEEKGGPTAIDVNVGHVPEVELSEAHWLAIWQRVREAGPYFAAGWRDGGGRKLRTVPGPDGKPIRTDLSVEVRVLGPFQGGSRYEIEGATFDGEAALSAELRRRLAVFRADKEGPGRFTLSVRLRVEIGPGVTVTEDQLELARKTVADSGVGKPEAEGVYR